MYLSHFGLNEAPFKITPNTGFFYSGANRGEILQALLYAIEQGEGIIKVTGEVGSGKTMLCRMLAEKLAGSHDTVYLANPHISPQEVLAAIALDLHLDIAPSASLLELTHAVSQHLLASHAAGKRIVLLVEEAQGMPLETLEEIRLLTNLETAYEKLLQIVLFGQPELDANLEQPAIRQLKERIGHNFVLRPLTLQETQSYLDHRLRAAGYRGPELFGARIVKELNRAAQGVSRRLNILAEKTLLAAYAENTHTITRRHAQAAISDSPFARKDPRFALRQLAGAALVLLVGLIMGNWLHLLPGQTPTPTAVAAPAAATTQPQATAPAPDPNRDLVDSRLQATERWLAQAADNTFTLQLFSQPDREQLLKHLSHLTDTIESEQIFVFRTKVKGKPSYSVTYGSYVTRGDAVVAGTHLPTTIRKNRPLIRSAGGIRAEIEATPGQGA